jgi:hypothetical protein
LSQYSGIIYKMPSVEEIRQKGHDWMRQQRTGTNSDVCQCGEPVILLEDESIIVGGNRVYKDGNGNLPSQCAHKSDCLARQLLE